MSPLSRQRGFFYAFGFINEKLGTNLLRECLTVKTPK